MASAHRTAFYLSYHVCSEFPSGGSLWKAGIIAAWRGMASPFLFLTACGSHLCVGIDVSRAPPAGWGEEGRRGAHHRCQGSRPGRKGRVASGQFRNTGVPQNPQNSGENTGVIPWQYRYYLYIYIYFFFFAILNHF